MRDSRLRNLSLRFSGWLAVMLMGLCCCRSADARWRHYSSGPSKQQIAAQRAYQEAAKKEAQRRVLQAQAEHRAMLEHFDKNHDGEISGSEKPAADKYLREERLGKVPPLAPPVSLPGNKSQKTSTGRK